MKDGTYSRVKAVADDARSGDDLVDDYWEYGEPTIPLDQETLDEQYSTQMGEMYEPRRRGAS